MFSSLKLDYFFTQSGLIFSNFAIKKIISENNIQKSSCDRSFFSNSKNFISICELDKNFQIWDPIDEVILKFVKLYLK